MGIEDIGLDPTEHADRVCVVSPSPVPYQTILEKRELGVVVASDLDEAVERCQDERIDLVVYHAESDAIMPEQAAEELRRRFGARVGPGIILAGNSESAAQADQAVGRRGTVRFLPRDARPSEVLVRVVTILRLRKLRAEDERHRHDVASENAALRDLTQRFQNELLEAQRVQQSILPTALPKDARCRFASSYVPLEAVGGDLYDMWSIDEDRYGFFIGDVTGHGLPAAFVGALTKMALSYSTSADPGKLLQRMNDGLESVMPEGRFVTALAAVYDAKAGLLQVARAGHLPALVIRAAAHSVECIEPPGFPLGVIPGATFETTTVSLHANDRMVLITDGLVETANLDGELLGIDGVCEFLKEVPPDAPMAQLLQSLLAHRAEFAGGRLLRDDITVVGLGVAQVGARESAESP
ncbi:MAG: SpoIIE family protein phosphatase [Bdellovibrionales bacterium]|nr:SpoIIE family protein phosphatase [Bdellovibrionales bacterium]